MGNEAKRRNQLTCAHIRVFDSISSNWFEVRFYLRISWLHQPSSKASWETRRRCFETLKSVSDEEWKTKQYIAHFASRCAATRVRVVWRNGMTRLRCSSTSRHAQRLTNFWVSRGDAALEFAICNMLWQQLQALGFQRAFWGIACLVLLPSHCNVQACTYHSAMFVKPHQWPTPSESIAIYCDRFAWCGSLLWLYKYCWKSRSIYPLCESQQNWYVKRSQSKVLVLFLLPSSGLTCYLHNVETFC